MLRPRAIPLAMDDHGKINSWVSSSFLYEYGAPLGGPKPEFDCFIRESKHRDVRGVEESVDICILYPNL